MCGGRGGGRRERQREREGEKERERERERDGGREGKGERQEEESKVVFQFSGQITCSDSRGSSIWGGESPQQNRIILISVHSLAF